MFITSARRRVITERRHGRVPKQPPGMIRVTLAIFEEPDVNDLDRVTLEILLLQLIHRPT